MKTLGFTRPASKLQASVEEAEAMGFRVFAAPSLDVIPGDPSEFERLAHCIFEGIPIIFGSTTAVDACSRQFGGDFDEMLVGCDVIAIGPETADRLRECDVRVDLVPEDYSSYGLLEIVRSRYVSGRIAIVRSDRGSRLLSDGLREHGLETEDIAVYRLREADLGPEMSEIMDMIYAGCLDWMAFTSPMSAESFFGRMRDRYGDD